MSIGIPSISLVVVVRNGIEFSVALDPERNADADAGCSDEAFSSEVGSHA